MENKQGHVSPCEAMEKDWEDFFEGWDIPEGTTYSVGKNDEWLCVASQHGRIQIQQTSERLAREAKKHKGPPVKYVFDR